MIETIPPEKFKDSMIEAGLMELDEEKPWEVRAVKYTDAFMLKNYGTAEPQRLNPSNEKLSDKPAPLIILKRLSQPYALTVYEDQLKPTPSTCGMATIGDGVFDYRELSACLNTPSSIIVRHHSR